MDSWTPPGGHWNGLRGGTSALAGRDGLSALRGLPGGHPGKKEEPVGRTRRPPGFLIRRDWLRQHDRNGTTAGEAAATLAGWMASPRRLPGKKDEPVGRTRRPPGFFIRRDWLRQHGRNGTTAGSGTSALAGWMASPRRLPGKKDEPVGRTRRPPGFFIRRDWLRQHGRNGTTAGSGTSALAGWMASPRRLPGKKEKGGRKGPPTRDSIHHHAMLAKCRHLDTSRPYLSFNSFTSCW